MVSYSAGDTLKVQLVPPLLSLTPRPNKNLRRSASTQGLGLHAPALNAAQASKQASKRECSTPRAPNFTSFLSFAAERAIPFLLVFCMLSVRTLFKESGNNYTAHV